MLQEDYKETQERAYSCLERKKKASDQNSELTLLSSFFAAAEQPEQQLKQTPRDAHNTVSRTKNEYIKLTSTTFCFFQKQKNNK